MSEKILLNAKKTYGKNTVLDVENLEISCGKTYAIIGANGCGKTTLLKAISGQLKFEGEIQFSKKLKPVYMPQQSFGFSLSVFNNLKLCYKLNEIKFKKDEAVKLMKDLDILHLKRKNAGKLSGGETQRVALARMLCIDADLYLLDEFTTSMDINNAKTCEEIVEKRIKDRGKTLIFTSHSMAQVEKLADIVIFLHKGNIKEILPANNFINNAKSVELVEFLKYMLNK